MPDRGGPWWLVITWRKRRRRAAESEPVTATDGLYSKPTQRVLPAERWGAG
jgi:hypothetical protein